MDDLPALFLYQEYSENDIESGSTHQWINLNFGIEAMKSIDFSASENIVTESQKMKADIYECLMSNVWYIDFTNGLALGEYINDTSLLAGTFQDAIPISFTGKVDAYTVDSGLFEDGDAAGTLSIRRLSQANYSAGNAKIETNIARLIATTTADSMTGISAADNISGSLADEIFYVGGGVQQFPEPNDVIAQVRMDFTIRFKHTKDDPYTQ